MHTTNQFETQQEATRLQSTTKTFFDNFSVGTLLNRCGIKKLKGASPLAIFEAIFLLAFKGQNFYRGIVLNEQLGFQKDAAYDLLKNPRYNWRHGRNTSHPVLPVQIPACGTTAPGSSVELTLQ